MSSLASHLLFTPIKVGNATLQHRIAMAPMTRLRSDKQHVPTEIIAEHFAQRGSTPGTLLITDATYIAQKAGGYDHAPGIWSDAQIKAWKKVRNVSNLSASHCFLTTSATIGHGRSS